MDHPVTFARHFAQLIRLVGESADVVGQKAALRSSLVASKKGTIALSTRGDDLVAGGQIVVPEPAIANLAQRIAATGLALWWWMQALRRVMSSLLRGGSPDQQRLPRRRS